MDQNAPSLVSLWINSSPSAATMLQHLKDAGWQPEIQSNHHTIPMAEVDRQTYYGYDRIYANLIAGNLAD